MAKILVTGASGFIGRNLCARLLREGHQLIALSRSGTSIANANNITLDFTKSSDISSCLDGVEVMIHLAARVHRHDDAGKDLQAQYRRINRDATIALAEQAAAHGVRRFLYVSSIHVNGNRTSVDHPFTESEIPRPQNLYAISKYEAEVALRELQQRSNMEITTVRPPLVYGPGAPGNFTRLMNLVQKGLPLPLGRIDNKRSFIYVQNLVDALLLCAFHPKAANNTYLVSDGIDVSTPQLIREIAGILHQPVHLWPVPVNVMRFASNVAGKAEMVDKLSDSLQVDSSKIRNQLGWVPPDTLHDGLEATLQSTPAASARLQPRSS